MRMSMPIRYQIWISNPKHEDVTNGIKAVPLSIRSGLGTNQGGICWACDT